MEWIALVATFLGGGLIGTIVTAWQGGTSEYYADVRHLRDLQAERVRAAFGPLLELARVLSDVTQDLNSPLQPADTTSRDNAMNEAITRAQGKLVDARIALQLEPRISKRIDPLFDEVQRAYRMFRHSIQWREQLRAQQIVGHPSGTGESVNELAEAVASAVDALHAEMLSLLTRLDEPAKKPWYVRDRLRT